MKWFTDLLLNLSRNPFASREFRFEHDATLALKWIARRHGLRLGDGASVQGVEGRGFMFTWTTEPKRGPAPACPDGKGVGK